MPNIARKAIGAIVVIAIVPYLVDTIRKTLGESVADTTAPLTQLIGVLSAVVLILIMLALAYGKS